MAQATQVNPQVDDPDVPKGRKAFVPLGTPSLPFHEDYKLTYPPRKQPRSNDIPRPQTRPLPSPLLP
jgi:hypothetical protein